jgi:penicillin-binding protein 1C
LRGSAYAMRLTDLDRKRIAFNATADADARAVYWFVDDAYVGRSAPGEAMFWQPQAAGSFRVRAVDDRGRSDERPLDVTLIQ